MGAFQFLERFVPGLIPPRDDSDPEAVYRWRVKIAFSIFLGGIVMTTHIALACGWLLFLFPGFASAGDLGELRRDLTVAQQQLSEEARDFRVELLDREIRGVRRDQCLAQQSGNQAALNYATDQLQGMIVLYRRLARSEYRLPQCDELVIVVPVLTQQPAVPAPPRRALQVGEP
jgi:hypothetical protein